MSVNWTDIKIDDQASFEITVTSEMIKKFVELSGDDNPLHVDEEFAKNKGHEKRVAHGMLLASFFSRLVGKYFLQDDNIYLSQTLEFRRPIFVGDKIIVSGIVRNKIESSKLLEIETKIIGPDSQLALRGQAQVKYQ